MSTADLALMASWPMLLMLDIADIGRVLFCHGTPRHHNEIIVESTSESLLRPLLDPLGVPLVVCGHTHMAFDRQVGSTRLVNAGSVGLPFGPPGADWLLLGPDVELRHTAYDVASAAARARQSPYIDAANFAAQLLEPPPPGAMTAAFSRAELRYGR